MKQAKDLNVSGNRPEDIFRAGMQYLAEIPTGGHLSEGFTDRKWVKEFANEILELADRAVVETDPVWGSYESDSGNG
jgi:hypothetical protein